MAENSPRKPLFRDLTAEDPDPEATEIESLCMECGENGITRLLLTKIPFYKEVVIMSFSCEHCGCANNEIQPGGKIQERGIEIRVRVGKPEDLNRQVVKSDYASVSIPELDFEIPSQSQKGEITTLEGVLERAISGLMRGQPLRRATDPESADRIECFLKKLAAARKGEMKFTFVLRDISGNSFVENLVAPHPDPATHMTHFARSLEEDSQLGIFQEETNSGDNNGTENISQEVLAFQTNCPHCGSPCKTNMKLTEIPHFKEVVIMATNCDVCGNRTNEVKSGGKVEAKGMRIELQVISPRDWNRDVLMSETCRMKIPELEFEGGVAVMGGRFTTLEGLLINLKDQLVGENQLVLGDSASSGVKERLDQFARKLDDVLNCKTKSHIILDDPAGNSYLQNLNAPAPDPEMVVTQYERSFQQNEELGLNDVLTEGYELS